MRIETELDKMFYNLCLEIEKLPASEQQTKVITMLNNLWVIVQKKMESNL